MTAECRGQCRPSATWPGSRRGTVGDAAGPRGQSSRTFVTPARLTGPESADLRTRAVAISRVCSSGENLANLRETAAGVAEACRSCSRRTWAATSAARSRPCEPPRNASRRSRCVRSGRTTTTVTAESSPRACTRTPRPTSLPPTSRPFRTSASSPSVEPGAEAEDAAAFAGGAGASASRWWAAAGASSASVSASRSHGTSPKRAASCRRSRPRRPSTSNRAPERRPDRVAPGHLVLGPDVVAEKVPRRSVRVDATSSSPLASPRHGPRPGRRRPRPGVRRDHRVRRPEQRLAEQVRDRRLADPRQPQRPARRLRAGAAATEPRQHLDCQIGRISRGGPGSATTTRAVRPVDPPAGRGPVAVRQRLGRRDQPGLLEVHRRHVIPRRDQSPRSQPRGPRRPPAPRRDRGDRLAGQVVRRRPEPAGGDDEVGPAERGRERVADRVEVVGEGLDPAAPRRPGRSGSGPARRRSCRASRRP